MPRSASTELEARLLGMCLTWPEAASRALTELSVEAFVAKEHRAIYLAITDVLASGRVPSPVAVLRALDRRRQALPDGVMEGLLEQASVPTDLDALIEALQEAQARRVAMAAAEELKRAAESEADFEELRDLLSRRALELVGLFGSSGTPVRHIRDGLLDVIAAVQDPSAGRRRRLAFGCYQSLGRALRGLEASRLYVIAARPSMGKTALALQIAWQACEMGKARAVLFVSLEMSLEDLAARLIAQRTGVDVAEAAQWAAERRREVLSRIDAELAAMSGLPLWVCDRRGLRVAEIAALARRVAVEQRGLDLLVVDHLGLVTLPGGKERTTAQKVGDVTRALRQLAGDLDVPVLLLAQLNREVEHRDNKRPTMADLRDSGNVEEHADVVLGLYRHRYYHPDLAEDDPRADKAEVLVLKNRTGEAGTSIVLRWVPQYVRYEECETWELRQYQEAIRKAA